MGSPVLIAPGDRIVDTGGELSTTVRNPGFYAADRGSRVGGFVNSPPVSLLGLGLVAYNKIPFYRQLVTNFDNL